MSPDNKDKSLFSKFRKDSAVPQAPPPLPPADNRVQVLEAALRDLKAEFDAYKARPLPPPSRSAPEPSDGRKEDAAVPSKEGFDAVDQRLEAHEAALERLGRALSGEGEVAARLERSEAALAELKNAFSAQQSQLKKGLEVLAPKEAMDALRVSVAAALAGFEDLKLRSKEYVEEFTGIESECRKALGEMQGYVKSAQERPLAERFDEYLKESVSRLNAKLAAAETAMHAGHAELSGRLNADSVLYGKIFSEAEDRLKKSLAPELKAAEGELRWLRDKVIWLMDEYKIVMERKVRALEGKYSAFEAFSARMDTISKAIEKGDK